MLTVLPLLIFAAANLSGDSDQDWINHGSDPKSLYSTTEFVYFTADDGIHGREPWRTDGTDTGSILLGDLRDGTDGSNPDGFVQLGPLVFFGAELPDRRFVFFTNGTPEGTKPLYSSDNHPVRLEAMTTPAIVTDGNRVYFPSTIDEKTWQLWSSDGTPEGTHAVSAVPPHPMVLRPRYLHASSRDIFYAMNPVGGGYVLFSLRAYNATEGDRLLGEDYSEGSPRGIVQDKLFFTVRVYEKGIEPHISDGTASGTRLLRDIMPKDSSMVWEPAVGSTGTFLVFPANDGIHGTEPWITDGTIEGTALLKDVRSGELESAPGLFEALGGTKIFFTANDGQSGQELWVTHGITENTHIVRDIAPGPEFSSPTELKAAGNVLYFTAKDPRSGEELWRTDGTGESTYLVKDIVPGPISATPTYKAPLGDGLVFAVDDGAHGNELWYTDGTEKETRLIKDIWPVRGPNPSSNPESLIAVGDLVFFVINDARHGSELWRSDGTQNGTFLVRDIFPGPASAQPAEFCVYEDKLYFQADDGERGRELWMCDGSEDGTVLVADINPGAASSSPHGLSRLGSKIGFAADDGVHGFELWRCDIFNKQLPALVVDLNPGPAGSDPKQFALVRERLFFVANNGQSGAELWETDLNESGTRIVADVLTRIFEGSRKDESSMPANPLPPRGESNDNEQFAKPQNSSIEAEAEFRENDRLTFETMGFIVEASEITVTDSIGARIRVWKISGSVPLYISPTGGDRWDSSMRERAPFVWGMAEAVGIYEKGKALPLIRLRIVDGVLDPLQRPVITIHVSPSNQQQQR